MPPQTSPETTEAIGLVIAQPATLRSADPTTIGCWAGGWPDPNRSGLDHRRIPLPTS